MLNGFIVLLILLLVCGIAMQAYLWEYDRGYYEGYEDGDYEGYACGVKDSNRQFKNMCDDVIEKQSKGGTEGIPLE